MFFVCFVVLELVFIANTNFSKFYHTSSGYMSLREIHLDKKTCIILTWKHIVYASKILCPKILGTSGYVNDFIWWQLLKQNKVSFKLQGLKCKTHFIHCSITQPQGNRVILTDESSVKEINFHISVDDNRTWKKRSVLFLTSVQFHHL